MAERAVSTCALFTIQVILEAVVGNGPHGDIAIDDTSFTPDCRRSASKSIGHTLKARGRVIMCCCLQMVVVFVQMECYSKDRTLV